MILRRSLPLALLGLLACLAPSDRRPGFHLSGDAAAAPSDWSFSDAHREIAIEVHAPYFLPHSVTIWCAALDGTLYVGAREPDTKRWPGWVERNPNARLAIGEQVFDVRLARVDDDALIQRVQRAYAAKYDLSDPPAGAAPPMRYWRVEQRPAD